MDRKKITIESVLIISLIVNIVVDIYKIIDTRKMINRNEIILEELKNLSD
ncbi:hypothetical protein H8S10_15075 [Clostridium sp. NSJ-49]|nr:hypothetical protein [Clostridium sp. NSJ-49]MBC5626762.1 hypothetical protein [Clostridium sp. NSJ-49]